MYCHRSCTAGECACAYIYLCRCALLRLWPGLVVVHDGHYAGAWRSSTWQGGGEVAFGTGESSKLPLIETNQPGAAKRSDHDEQHTQQKNKNSAVERFEAEQEKKKIIKCIYSSALRRLKGNTEESTASPHIKLQFYLRLSEQFFFFLFFFF